jgi:hypothetical protein
MVYRRGKHYELDVSECSLQPNPSQTRYAIVTIPSGLIRPSAIAPTVANANLSLWPT